MGITVLIVDDSRSTRQQVGFILAREGYNVIEAEDGADGLAKAKENPVTMIISDVNMPGMGGIQMVEAIRRIEELKFVPIIMLTTEAGGDKVESAKRAGASGWLVKPFSPEQLVAAVKRLAR